MGDGVYIGYVEIPAAVAHKLRAKHQIEPDEVREVCAWRARDQTAVWHDHETHGRRLIVTGRTSAGRKLHVILQPVNPDDGLWRLRTAVPATRGRS